MNKKSLIMIAFLSIIILSGCNKDDISSPTSVDFTKTAKLVGIVGANIDAANDTTNNGTYQLKMDSAPIGTKIIFKVFLGDYVTYPQGNYGFKLYETTVGDDGYYSFDIPATEAGLDVTIIPVEFSYYQKLNNDGASARKIFKVTPFTIYSVMTGETRITDFNYSIF